MMPEARKLIERIVVHRAHHHPTRARLGADSRDLVVLTRRRRGEDNLRTGAPASGKRLFDGIAPEEPFTPRDDFARPFVAASILT
jgi:hypothetical protein